MLTLPIAIVPILAPFAMLFTNPTWRKAQLLLVGAILATGQRTVAAALRVMGLSNDRNSARYHHVLNRADWSPLESSQILLRLLLQHLDRGDGPLVFGIDETLERPPGSVHGSAPWGSTEIQCAPVGVTPSKPVRQRRTLGVPDMAGTDSLGRGRYWALPFLTVLAPSERYHQTLGRRHNPP